MAAQTESFGVMARDGDRHGRRRETGHGRALLGAGALMLTASLFLASLALRLPQEGEPAALVFAPGTTPARALTAIAALDGQILRTVRGNVIVARFARDLSYGDLRRVGAWLALDPLVAAGCGAPAADRTSSGFPS